MTTKVGLCGFTMSAARYPHYFRVVEIQQTFYQPPAAWVIDRWRTRMPPDFEFTLKAWMLITHASSSPTYRRLRRVLSPAEAAGAGNFQDSALVEEAWQTTLDATRRLRATAILFQCPARFRPARENLANLRAFFTRIVRPTGVRLLFEPRGPAWTSDLVRPLVTDLDLTHVVDPFVAPTVSAAIYYRLHGTTGARHIYTQDELRHLASLVADKPDAYVMFNNIPRVNDAERFQALLAQRARRSA